jgi:hypothetical protein
MKNRADLRKVFVDKANQEKSTGLLSEQSALLSEISDLQVETFNKLILFLGGRISKTEVVNQLKEIGTPDVLKLLPKLDKIDQSVIGSKTDLKPVIDALNDLKQEFTLIPDKMPVPESPKDTVQISNLDEIRLDTSAVERAIKALKLAVNVDAPIINTEKTDLGPLQSIMLDLLKAINKQKPVEIPPFPEIPKTDLKSVEKKLDESNKQLGIIAEKRFGGGGGGGGVVSYVDSAGIAKTVELVGGKVPMSIVGEGIATEATLAKTVGFDVNSNITTDLSTPGVIIETDGVKTLTTTISGTTITEVWS